MAFCIHGLTYKGIGDNHCKQCFPPKAERPVATQLNSIETAQGVLCERLDDMRRILYKQGIDFDVVVKEKEKRLAQLIELENSRWAQLNKRIDDIENKLQEIFDTGLPMWRDIWSDGVKGYQVQTDILEKLDAMENAAWVERNEVVNVNVPSKSQVRRGKKGRKAA